MKENKAVYVTKRNIKENLGRDYNFHTNYVIRDRDLPLQTLRYDKTQEVGTQFNSKRDDLICTCRNLTTLRKRPDVRYFEVPNQVYAYQERSRSFTDIGIGTVKALQRKKVKRIYLPETDDRGCGSSDLSTYFIRRTKQHRPKYYYESKSTSSKCIGGILEYSTGCVMSEKLSPIVQTASGSTSPWELTNRNIEIGSNTITKSLKNTTTQVDEVIDKEIEIKIQSKESVKQSDDKSKQPIDEKITIKIKSTTHTNTPNNKDKPNKGPEKYSSDSLVQHVHDLETPSDVADKQSRCSEDPMENKLEREYRKIFSTKSKECKKSSTDRRLSDYKSASTLKRGFEALRRGLVKNEESKKNSIIATKMSSQVSICATSHRDVSINSDPPSLEARSYSHTKMYSPHAFPSIVEHDKPIPYNPLSLYNTSVSSRQERDTVSWPKTDEEDSESQGVKGMFKLWGKKFNLEEEHYKPNNTSKSSYVSKKSIKKEGSLKMSSKMNTEDKDKRKFFFFKKKNKEKPFKPKKGVTAGRCEVKDGLMIKIGNVSPPKPEEQVQKTERVPDVYEETMMATWLQKFLSQGIDSQKSVKVRWNNKTYSTSSSTVFELMDNVYKDTGVVFRSKSEVTVESSYYKSYTKQQVNFVHQTIQAWMIPKTILDHPRNLPVKVKRASNKSKNENMEVRISDHKWFIDKSKAFSHKIEVILLSINVVRCNKKQSSEYLRIDIPKGFFVDSSDNKNMKPKGDHISRPNHSSDEEVYKIIEYETGSDLKKEINIRKLDVGNHKQNNIKVTVSVRSSKEMKPRVLDTTSKTLPERRDVIGVGIITRRDMRLKDPRKPILKFQDYPSDDESDHNLKPQNKKCELAESYLREYYRHWTPLGIDLLSWCVSDSHLRCSSETSKTSINNQGDGSKSCPNIFDDFQTLVSSCHTISRCYTDYDPEPEKPPCWYQRFKKKKKSNNKNNKKVEMGLDIFAAKREFPKDSFAVFRKRRIYAQSNKSKWRTPEPCDTPVKSVPSYECKAAGSPCSKEMKPCWRPCDTRPRRKSCDGKHVSLPNCEEMITLSEKINDNLPPESILAFKSTSRASNSGCDGCRKKECKVNPVPSCQIPPVPCQISCEKMKKPPCQDSKISCDELARRKSCNQSVGNTQPLSTSCSVSVICPPLPPPCNPPPCKPLPCNSPPCKPLPCNPSPCKPPPCNPVPCNPPPCKPPPCKPPPCKPPPCKPPPCKPPPCDPPPCKPPLPQPCKSPPCSSPKKPVCVPKPCENLPPLPCNKPASGPCQKTASPGKKLSPPSPCCSIPSCKSCSSISSSSDSCSPSQIQGIKLSTPPAAHKCPPPLPPCPHSHPPCPEAPSPCPHLHQPCTTPCRRCSYSPPLCPYSSLPCPYSSPPCPYSTSSHPHTPQKCPSTPSTCPFRSSCCISPPCPPKLAPPCPKPLPPCTKKISQSCKKPPLCSKPCPIPPQCINTQPKHPNGPPCPKVPKKTCPPPAPPETCCVRNPALCPMTPISCKTKSGFKKIFLKKKPTTDPCSPPPCKYQPCRQSPPPSCRQSSPPSYRQSPPPSCRPSPPPSCRQSSPPSCRQSSPPSCRLSPPASCRLSPPASCRLSPTPPCRLSQSPSYRPSSPPSCKPSPPCKTPPLRKPICMSSPCCQPVSPRSCSPLCQKFSVVSAVLSYGSLKQEHEAPFRYSPVHPCPPGYCDEEVKLAQNVCNRPSCMNCQDTKDQSRWTKKEASTQSSVSSFYDKDAVEPDDWENCFQKPTLQPRLSCEDIPPSPKKKKICEKKTCPNHPDQPPQPDCERKMVCPPPKSPPPPCKPSPPPCLPPPPPCPPPPPQCPPPPPPSTCPPKLLTLPSSPTKSKVKLTGVHLKMTPSSKKTCSSDCIPLWPSPIPDDACLNFNSDDKITIRLKKDTPSTEEIREGLNIKVQDEDGLTLYERKDYRQPCRSSAYESTSQSLLGDLYRHSHVHRVAAPLSAKADTNKVSCQEVSEDRSDTSIANTIEIQFKLKVIQGDNTTEINVTNDHVKDNSVNNDKPLGKQPQDVLVLDSVVRSNENIDGKNDINIRILIKNFKPKERKKFSRRDDYSNEFSKQISAKFHSVSTGYSDIAQEDDAEHAFSIHRATVDLTSSAEKMHSRQQSEEMMSQQIEQEPDKIIMSSRPTEESVCRCIIEERLSPIGDGDLDSLQSKASNNDSQPNETQEESDIEKPETDFEKPETDTEKLDTDMEKAPEPKYNIVLSTDTDDPDVFQDHVGESYEQNKLGSVEKNIKPLTKDEKKKMLKQVFEKTNETKKSKSRMRKLRDMLKVILTSDSSEPDEVKLPIASTNDLAKDITYASLKPNYFRDTDSMNNYYRAESNAAFSDREINKQVIYPTEENNSECTKSSYMTSDNDTPPPQAGTCICNTVAERLKMVSRMCNVRENCCCSNRKARCIKSEETFCDFKKDSDYYEDDDQDVEYIDVETQNSTYLNSKVTSANLSFRSQMKSSIMVMPFNLQEDVRADSQRQIGSTAKKHNPSFRKFNRDTTLSISDEDKIVLLSDKSTKTVSNVSKSTEYVNKFKDEENVMREASDILQSYETKKAVLEIYTENTASNEGESLVAKLPKFVYDTENELYDAIAANANTYKVCRRNIVMMTINR